MALVDFSPNALDAIGTSADMENFVGAWPAPTLGDMVDPDASNPLGDAEVPPGKNTWPSPSSQALPNDDSLDTILFGELLRPWSKQQRLARY
jgi:hypothetical protein